MCPSELENITNMHMQKSTFSLLSVGKCCFHPTPTPLLFLTVVFPDKKGLHFLVSSSQAQHSYYMTQIKAVIKPNQTKS